MDWLNSLIAFFTDAIELVRVFVGKIAHFFVSAYEWVINAFNSIAAFIIKIYNGLVMFIEKCSEVIRSIIDFTKEVYFKIAVIVREIIRIINEIIVFTRTPLGELLLNAAILIMFFIIIRKIVKRISLNRRRSERRGNGVVNNQQEVHPPYRNMNRTPYPDRITMNDPTDLTGLVDALTGDPLDRSKGLYICRSCKVYFHRASYQTLVEKYDGKCASCGSEDLALAIDGHHR